MGASSSSIFAQRREAKKGEVAHSAGGVPEMPVRHNLLQKRILQRKEIMYCIDPLPATPYSPYRHSFTALRCATEGEQAVAYH